MRVILHKLSPTCVYFELSHIQNFSKEIFLSRFEEDHSQAQLVRAFVQVRSLVANGYNSFSEISLVEVVGGSESFQDGSKLIVDSLIRAACGKSTLDNLESFDETTIPKLRAHVFTVEVLRAFSGVGLNASDKVGGSRLQSHHQLFQLPAENAAD